MLLLFCYDLDTVAVFSLSLSQAHYDFFVSFSYFAHCDWSIRRAVFYHAAAKFEAVLIAKMPQS